MQRQRRFPHRVYSQSALCVTVCAGVPFACCSPQAATARVLAATGSPTAAEEMLRDTFQRAVTSLGTKDTAVEDTLRIHWRLLHTTLGKPQAAEDLKRLAEQMGCDVSVCQKDESDTYVGALGAVQLPTLPYTERIYSYQSD